MGQAPYSYFRGIQLILKTALSGLFLFSGAALAGLTYSTTIRAVDYRGNHQRTGNLTLLVRGDVLAAANLAHPLYVSIEMDHGAKLAETLVDQGGGPAVASPILLPLQLDGEPGVTVAAEPDALRIVRWVAGEERIWLEFRQSSDEWLTDGVTLFGPNPDNIIKITLGLSARQSDQIHVKGGNANLPFASRESKAAEGDYAAALSLLLCLDLRDATLLADGSDEALLKLDPKVWASVTVLGDGRYEGVTPMGCIMFGEYAIAQGKSRTCGQTSFQASLPTLLPGPSGTVRSRSHLTASFGCSAGANILPTVWAEGSHLVLRAQGENVGFETTPQVTFTQGWEGYAQVRPETAFTIGGLTLYREAELIYTGPDQTTDHQDLEVDLELIYPLSSAAQPAVVVETKLLPFVDTADSAPYNGAHQYPNCEPQPYSFAPQTVDIAGPAVPTLNPWGLTALIASLCGFAFVRRKMEQRRTA